MSVAPTPATDDEPVVDLSLAAQIAVLRHIVATMLATSVVRGVEPPLEVLSQLRASLIESMSNEARGCADPDDATYLRGRGASLRARRL
jgi:hypothetical protein